MKKLAIVIAALAVMAAQAADYQGAVVWKIETTTATVVPWSNGAWDTDGLFELYAHPGVHGVRVRDWNVPGMAAPTEAELAALATNETAQAYRSIPRTAEETAFVNLLDSLGVTMPLTNGQFSAISALVQSEIAAAKVTNGVWRAIELQEKSNNLLGLWEKLQGRIYQLVKPAE